MSIDELDAPMPTRASNPSESAPVPTSEVEDSSVDVRMLAEAVMVMLESAETVNQANTKALNQLRAAHVGVTAAPELMRQGVQQGIQSSLEKLDTKEKALNLRLKQVNQRGKAWLLSTLATGVLLGGLLISASVFWLGPQIKQFRDYRNSHSAIERDSLFGAQVRENAEGDQFIVFDDGISISKCSVPNCVSISQ